MHMGAFKFQRGCALRRLCFHVFFLWIFHWIPLTLGGVCWKSFDRSTKLCLNAFNINVTFTECCNHTGSPSLSWSPHTVPGDIFYHNFLSGGADQCQPCHTNCSTVTCEKGKVCRMRDGLPNCVCQSHCDAELRARGRTCGTDRHVYKNACVLEKRNCLTGRNVGVEYFGKCKNSCKHVTCEPGKRCLEDQNGLPHCVVCPGRCTRTIADPHPVCGVNGVTYANTCDLKAAICREGSSIKIAYEEECNANLTCSNFKCPLGQSCLTNPDSGQPVCRTCKTFCLSTDLKQICGTDGRTYSTYCNMLMSSCNTGIYVTTKRSGRCKKQSKLHAMDNFKTIQNTLNEPPKSGRSKKARRRADRRARQRERRREKKRQRQRKRKNKAQTKLLLKSKYSGSKRFKTDHYSDGSSNTS